MILVLHIILYCSMKESNFLRAPLPSTIEHLERAAGVEPVSRPWQGRGLTVVLRPQIWWLQVESNHPNRLMRPVQSTGQYSHFGQTDCSVGLSTSLLPSINGWGGWICTNVATALIAPDLQSYNRNKYWLFCESFGHPTENRTRD